VPQQLTTSPFPLVTQALMSKNIKGNGSTIYNKANTILRADGSSIIKSFNLNFDDIL
jgi:hypothetical protein